MTRSTHRTTRPALGHAPAHPTRATLAGLSTVGLSAGATLTLVRQAPSPR